MKAVALLSITFISTSSMAGMILPNMSKSKSIPNLTPIAVGYAQRKAATLNGSYTATKASANNVAQYEDKSTDVDGNIFYHHGSLINAEVTAGYNKTKTDNKLNNKSSSNRNNDVSVTAAITPNDLITAGVNYSQQSNNDYSESLTKTIDNSKTLTPAVGIKLNEKIAIGAGMNYERQTTTVKAANSTNNDTTYPTLTSKEFFLGAAYGVDQKAGANGFGTELVYSHKGKEKVTGNNITVSQGTLDSFYNSTHYLTDDTDTFLQLGYGTGKDYDNTSKNEMMMVALRSEYYFHQTVYVAPVLSYVDLRTKSLTSASNNETKAAGYGLSLGYRTKIYDIELGYLRARVNTYFNNSNFPTEVRGGGTNLRASYYF